MKILEAYDTNGLKIRNRLAMAAVTRGMSDQDGRATVEMARYYENFARSGVGLIMTEAIFIDEQYSQTYVGQPGLVTGAQRDAWSSVIKSVHRQGAKIFAQLQHGGVFREPSLGPGLNATRTIPSSLSWQQRQPYTQVRYAEAEDLARVVEGFRRSAILAREAGFDGIELHGARGYLLDAFMSGGNDRDDVYGGSLENRMRFPLSVVSAVRNAVPDVLLSYNLSLYKMDMPDYQPPGGAGETEAIVAALADAEIDILHVSTRTVDRCRVGITPLVDIVRKRFGKTMIAGGGLKSLADANAVVSQGRSDIVSMARILLANPDIIARYRDNLPLTPYCRGIEKIPVN